MKNIMTQEEINRIDEVCEKYNLENYTINSDGSIDVDGCVDLNYLNFKKLPLRFGKVMGHFECYYNKLTSLEGGPSYVGGLFSCDFNKLTSLEFSPESVGGSFDCSNNKLTSLEFISSSIGGDFDCSHNILTSLEGSPESLGGRFDCKHNRLTSLKGCPESVGGSFGCNYNLLPQHFMDLHYNLSIDEIMTFIKYQHDLRIWGDNRYNEEAAQDLYEEIKDGMR